MLNPSTLIDGMLKKKACVWPMKAWQGLPEVENVSPETLYHLGTLIDLG